MYVCVSVWLWPVARKKSRDGEEQKKKKKKKLWAEVKMKGSLGKNNRVSSHCEDWENPRSEQGALS